MSTLVVVRQVVGSDGARQGAKAYFWCPGCNDLHGIGVQGDDGSHAPVEWEFNGSLTEPTASPSILCQVNSDPPRRCHSYLIGGQWKFLSDCTHALAGQEGVAMVPLPDWMVGK